MPKVTKINHVGIAVANIDDALMFWRDILGVQLDRIEDVPSSKSKVAFLPVGDSDVELVFPTADDAPVSKFIAEKGGGMHHLCVEVDDISAMLAHLKEKGVRLIDEEPKVLDRKSVV